MRTLGVVALVFTAGCSLLWDMSPYEGGSGAAGPGASDGGSSSGASSSGTSSSGASSSGASSSGDGDASILEGGAPSSGDSGADAGQMPCTDTEDEPNEDEIDATKVGSGKTCGTISSFGDDDWFEVDAAAPMTITIELGVNVRVQVEYATGGTGISTTPGVKNVPLPPGSNLIHFASLSGSTGAYAIIRP